MREISAYYFGLPGRIQKCKNDFMFPISYNHSLGKENTFYYILERKCFNLIFQFNKSCHRKKKCHTIIWIFKELVRNRQGTNS